MGLPRLSGAGISQRPLEKSLRVIITLLSTTIDRRTPCDLTNNILGHILRADASMNFIVPFLTMTLSTVPGSSFGGGERGKKATQSCPVSASL